MSLIIYAADQRINEISKTKILLGTRKKKKKEWNDKLNKNNATKIDQEIACSLKWEEKQNFLSPTS